MDLLSLDTPVANPVNPPHHEPQPLELEHHNAEAYAASPAISKASLQRKSKSRSSQNDRELQSIRNELSTFYQQQLGNSNQIDITIQNRQTSKIINKSNSNQIDITIQNRQT